MLYMLDVVNLMAKVESSYGGFVLISWTGIFLGFLHSIMPCEDKAIFCFYAFGVARDWKQALRIVNFYGLGLMIMNLAIGTILTYFAAMVGPFLQETIGVFVINGLASLSLIISGIIMLYQIKKNKYLPHASQLQDLTEGLGHLQSRKRTAFILGLLAGIPPCIFEIAVYLHGITLSTTYGWGNGVWVFFFFGIGTWIGLIPLAILGTMSGRLSKWLRGSSFRRIRDKFKTVKEKNLSIRPKSENQDGKDGKDSKRNEASSKERHSNDVITKPVKNQKEKHKKNYSKIEIYSAIILILLGIVFLVLAILQIDVFYLQQPPEVPAPF